MPEAKTRPQKPLEIVRNDMGITLQQYTSKDADEIFALIDKNREHLSQHEDVTASKYPSVGEVLESIEKPKNPNKLRFGIRNSEGEMVGTVNLTPDKKPYGEAEIGFYLGKGFTGKGYMAKAVLALTGYAFGELGYKSLYAKVHEDNEPSKRLIKRANYHFHAKEKNQLIFTKES